jgi:hypothetical protein
MTGPDLPELTELLRRQSEALDPAAGERILAQSLAGGARRRRSRQAAVTLSGLVAAAVVATGVAAVTGGTPESAPDRGPAASPSAGATGSPAPTAEPTYDEGSATEVPGGPMIPTGRVVVDEEALGESAGYQLVDRRPGDKTVSDQITRIRVHHIESSTPSHMADRTRNGRRIDVTFEDAGVSIAIQRWDGYAAVGIDPQASPAASGEIDGPQKAATTAREACAGSYRAFPPVACTEVPEGWYSVSRTGQGAYRELLVTLYTHDGYVVRVESRNSLAEKSGPPVADQPVLTEAKSLDLARSPEWFREP